ncbi:conserved hypothetical protein [Ricinus communis]|uniref:Uncharacterized protein n=1 Tax=Ricinus communis TaxID=3988 RepID=B9T8X6_RICCO|nr:conserved hypothetical protein [Ricinus communis]
MARRHMQPPASEAQQAVAGQRQPEHHAAPRRRAQPGGAGHADADRQHCPLEALPQRIERRAGGQLPYIRHRRRHDQ